MFRWRKRNDGFEWRTYVRTTVLARRAHRRQKLAEVGEAAVESVRDAGRRSAGAGVAGARAFRDRAGAAGREGARYAGIASRHGLALAAAGLRSSAAGLRAAAGQAGAAGARGSAAMALAAGHVARSSAPALHDLSSRISRPEIATQLGIVGGGLALAAIIRWATNGMDMVTSATGLVALVLLALTATAVGANPASNGRLVIPRTDLGLAGVSRDRLLVAALVVGLVIAGAVLWEYMPKGTPDGSPILTSTSVVQGRATAVSSDVLQIGGRSIKLSGVEAPDRNQDCPVPRGRTRKCGALAEQALASLVRGKDVRCTVSGSDVGGRMVGACVAGGSDLAEDLIRRGVLFADGGMFGAYRSAEATAQSDKAGFWIGDPQRPQDYRADLWEAAKRRAPDGCPIKGQLTQSGRVYLLPWQASYERTRVRSARGERWFCSEDEAKAAGWQPRKES